MEAVLQNFKAIACPLGDRCKQSSCPWKHSWDERGRQVDPDGAQNPHDDRQAATQTGREVSATKRARQSISPPPLKRSAVASDNGECASRSTAVVSSSGDPTIQEAPSVAIQDKACEASAPIERAAKPGATSKGSPHASMRTPQVKKPETPKHTARKPEQLNPRHLKVAPPAQHEFRYRCLKMLHEQMQRLNNKIKLNPKDSGLAMSDQDLIWMALDVEEQLATDKPTIYNNTIKHRIMHYKRMTVEKWKEERDFERAKLVETTIPTPRDAIGPPRVINTGLKPEEEIQVLRQLWKKLTPDLAQHGFVTTAPTDEEITMATEAEEASQGWEKCDRCTRRFQVFPGRREDGVLASGGTCTYHPGRVYFPVRAPGDTIASVKRYRCCQESVGDSAGCETASTHVFKTTDPKRLAVVAPFVATPPNPEAPKDRAVCFDCEMGYTVRGMELIRITATSWPKGEELLDVLVRPVGEVLDLNSRFSGVWPEDMMNASPWTRDAQPPQKKVDGTQHAMKRKQIPIVSSPAIARDLLFSLISPETLLIGHGLENDLNAARIIHPINVDTSILFPHKRGLPYRSRLKILVADHLKRVIQIENDDTAMGHDSAEDARAAGDLARYKVETEWAIMRGKGWKFEAGRLVDAEGQLAEVEVDKLSETCLETRNGFRGKPYEP